jgi:hypothetical protein
MSIDSPLELVEQSLNNYQRRKGSMRSIPKSRGLWTRMDERFDANNTSDAFAGRKHRKRARSLSA